MMTAAIQTPSPVTSTEIYPDNTFRRIFYPMGFPVLLETNCEEIVELAAEMWPANKSFGSPQPACLFQLNLQSTGSWKTPCIPQVQQRGLLTYFNGGEENFVACDPAGGYAVGWINEVALESPLYLQQYFLRAVVMLMLAEESRIFYCNRQAGSVLYMRPPEHGLGSNESRTGTQG